MPKLPDETSLARRMPTGGTPQISVKGLDYSPMARSGEAVGQGISAVGRGFSAMAEANAEIDDFDTKKKLLDFKLKTEMDLENFSREMPPGGDGFSEAWQKRYMDQAHAFFGKDGQNIPLSQRKKVDFQLFQHDTSLSERAQRAALKEQDRFHVDELESSLGQYKDVVGANPDRHGEMGDEGRKLIELSRIPSADKYRLVKKYEKELDKSKATAFLMMPKTPENRDRLKAELRLDQEDVPGADVSKTLTSGMSKGKPAGWAASDPTWAKLSPFQKAAAMSLMEADGMDASAARNALGAMINRAAKNGEDLGAHVSQKIYQPTIESAQQARLSKIINSKSFDDMTAWAERRAQGAEPDPVNGATHFLASEKTMLALEAKEPQKYKSWRQWTGFNGSEYNGVITRDGSHAFLAPEGRHESQPGQALDPSRPYANLSIGERRAVWKQYETEWKGEISKVDTEIKHLNERATNGDLPPDIELQQIAGKIKNLGDPVLQAKYDSTLSLANTINKMFLAPPQAAEAFVRNTRTAIAEAQGGRYTEDQEKHLKHLEKAEGTIRKNVNEDPLGWAHKRQLEVPTGDLAQPGQTDEMGQAVEQPRRKVSLKPIDFNPANKDLDASLTERFEVGREVGRYYNQPPQFFSKSDRDALKDAVAKGGAPMVHILGKIVANGGDDALSAIREFSKDAPEAYMIGKLMSEGGDRYLIETAAKEIQKRATEKEKYINKVDRKMVDPDVSALMPALQMTPGLQDPIKHLTDAVYNFEHRRQGKDAFDSKLYVDTMRKVMGERKDAKGNVYGGVGTQGGMFGGSGGWSQTKVQVPSEVRQDSFDNMVSAIRLDDLVGSRPMHGDKTPLTLREIQTAQWRSIGNGRYRLHIETLPNGKERFAIDAGGAPFTIDVKPMLGKIRSRKPEIFDGGGALRLTDDQLDNIVPALEGISVLDPGYRPGNAESDMVDDIRPSTMMTGKRNLKAAIQSPAPIDGTPEQLKRLLPQMQEGQ